MTFSSRFSRLNHCLILVRAWLDLQMPSQSRLGPLALREVRISMMSPFFQGESILVIRLLTLAPIMELPTPE